MVDFLTPSIIVGNLAYAITAGALLVRDILWLRVLGAIANSGFIVSNIVAPLGTNYIFLGWMVTFLAINLFQIVNLILERRNTQLTAEDQDLHTAVFPNLPHGEFRLLLKSGNRKKVRAGTMLAEQGRDVESVALIERGAVLLERDGKPVERLTDGRMLGEVAFVAGRPFSSRAVAETDTHLVVWERAGLDRLFVRRPSIALGFHAAFIGQLTPGATRKEDFSPGDPA